ncbi:MAG: hypothetical protein V4549_05800 [Bacteroidota bacterium]
MKTYVANDELVEILQKQGFKETTSLEDKIRGKKEFRLSKHAPRKIFFNHVNIEIRGSRYVSDSRIGMTESEFKLMLLHFKLSAADGKEFGWPRNFDFSETQEKIDSLENELENLMRFNIFMPRQNKIKRILETYENIKLN